MLPEIGQRTRRILQALVILGIFIFLGLQLWENWGQILSYEWELNYSMLLISGAFIVLYYTLYGAAWKLALERLGERITLRKSLRVWMLSRLGWYIPGRIWIVLGRVHLAAKEGISRANCLISMALDIILATVCALLVFLFTLPFWPESSTASGYYPLLLFIPLGLVVLHPRLMRRFLNFVMRKLGKEALLIKIRYRDVISLLVPYCLLWIIYGIAFFFLVAAVNPIGFIQMPAIIGMYGLSWALGFLSIITPGGLGVREGILALLLSVYFPVPVAILISLLSRAWLTLIEVAYIVLSFKL